MRSRPLSERTVYSGVDGAALKLAGVTAILCIVVMLGLAFIANLVG
jgi:hypothetical protein